MNQVCVQKKKNTHKTKMYLCIYNKLGKAIGSNWLNQIQTLRLHNLSNICILFSKVFTHASSCQYILHGNTFLYALLKFQKTCN